MAYHKGGSLPFKEGGDCNDTNIVLRRCCRACMFDGFRRELWPQNKAKRDGIGTQAERCHSQESGFSCCLVRSNPRADLAPRCRAVFTQKTNGGGFLSASHRASRGDRKFRRSVVHAVFSDSGDSTRPSPERPENPRKAPPVPRIYMHWILRRSDRNGTYLNPTAFPVGFLFLTTDL